jgi:hypothetical protein
MAEGQPAEGQGLGARLHLRGRHWLGIELNPSYAEIAKRRLSPVMNDRLPTGGPEA